MHLFSFTSAVFSLTAESFGVSAQIGSGVVRGDPELRFHQGSTRRSTGFTRVPQGSIRVPPGSARPGWSGWFEVRFHEGSTRVPPISSRAAGLTRVPPGSTRVDQNSVRVLPGSARAAGWFEVRFHERFHQVSTRFH